MPPTASDRRTGQKEPEAKRVISTKNRDPDKKIADGFLPRCFLQIEEKNDTGKSVLNMNRKIRHSMTQVAII